MSTMIRKVLIAVSLLAASVTFAQTAEDKKFAEDIHAAVALYRDGKVNEAVTLMEDLRRQRPEDADANAWLGFLYLRVDRVNDAIPPLEKASEKRPNDPDIANNLGTAYLNAGQSEKALAQFKTFVGLKPSAYEGWYNIGTLQLKAQRYSEAETALLKALELKPAEAFCLNNLGAAYEGMGEAEKSAQAYGRASDVMPNHPAFAQNAAFAYYNIKRNAEAAKYLERAASLGVNDPAMTLARANILISSGKSAEAKRLLEDAASNGLTSGELWFNLGVLRRQAGDLNGAEEAYTNAMALLPDDQAVIQNLALIYVDKKDYAKASTWFKRQLEMDPNNLEAKLNLAACCVKTNDLDGAIRIWGEYLQAKPSRTDIRVQYANALWLSGSRDKAMTEYKKVLNSSPDNPAALNAIGVSHLMGHKVAEAEPYFRKAIASDKRFIPAYNNLAITLERMGKKKNAIEILKRALAIDPSDEDAQKNYKRMTAPK